MATRLAGVSTFILASPFSNQDAAAFDKAAAWGYDLIEVCIENPDILTADWVAEQSNRTGLQVGICGAFGPLRDISSEDEAIRESARNYLMGCVDFAAHVGSPHVAGPMYATTGVTRRLSPADRAAQRKRAADGLREVAYYAGELGVTLAIEPLNRFETDLVNTLAQGVDLCEQIGLENVGLLIDTFHMNIEEKDFRESIVASRGYIRHVQVSENDRGTPGTGHIPWTDFFAALDEIGYDGQIVVESFLESVEEIARAVSLWRPVADSMDDLASDAIAFLTVNGAVGRRSDRG